MFLGLKSEVSHISPHVCIWLNNPTGSTKKLSIKLAHIHFSFSLKFSTKVVTIKLVKSSEQFSSFSLYNASEFVDTFMIAMIENTSKRTQHTKSATIWKNWANKAVQ